MTIEKLNFETAEKLGPDSRVKQAAKSQNVFRAVVKRAKSMGMKVNTAKINLLVVSDALSYNPVAKIEDELGRAISSANTIKILGFHMSD